MQDSDASVRQGWVRVFALALGCYALGGGVTSFSGWALDVRASRIGRATASRSSRTQRFAYYSVGSLILLAHGRRAPAAGCAAFVAAIAA